MRRLPHEIQFKLNVKEQAGWGWTGDAMGVGCCRQKDSTQEDPRAGACLPGHWAAFAAGAEGEGGVRSRGAMMGGQAKGAKFCPEGTGETGAGVSG